MQKLLKVIWALLIIVAFFSLPLVAKAESSAYIPAFANASDLIDGVNAIRSSQGLNSFQSNSILNSIAQQQAEYELSIGSQTDTGPGGSRPFQRALAAGYLLASETWRLRMASTSAFIRPTIFLVRVPLSLRKS